MADAKPKVPPSAVKKKKPNNKASQIYYALGAAGAALLLLILVGLLKRPVIERPPRGPGQRQAPQNAPQQQQQGDAPGAENSWPWGEGTYWTKEITKEGNGPIPQKNDLVTFHYVGTLPATGQIFDSSRGRGAASINVGMEPPKLVPGVDQALRRMRTGERAVVKIHPLFAYGENGIPGVIPPNSELLFDLEVVGIGVEAATKARMEAEMLKQKMAASAGGAGEGAAGAPATGDETGQKGAPKTPEEMAAMQEQIMKMLKEQYGENVRVDLGEGSVEQTETKEGDEPATEPATEQAAEPAGEAKSEDKPETNEERDEL